MEIDIEKLICEIQKRRHLYDTTTAECSDRNVKKKLWEEVCVQLIADWDKLEIQDKIKQGKGIQKKWSSLRDCFRRELAQQKKTPPGSAAKKRRKYIYFDQLLFLLPFTQLTQTSSSLDNEQDIPSQQNNADESQLDHAVRPSESEPSLISPIPHKKKKTQKNYDEEILQVLKESNKGPTQAEIWALVKESNKKKDLDEDELFLMSLLPELKKYDEEKKYFLRIELMNTILRFDRTHRQCVTTETSFQNSEFPLQNSTVSYQFQSDGIANHGDRRYGYYTAPQTNIATNSWVQRCNQTSTALPNEQVQHTINSPLESPGSYMSDRYGHVSDLLSLGNDEDMLSPGSKDLP